MGHETRRMAGLVRMLPTAAPGSSGVGVDQSGFHRVSHDSRDIVDPEAIHCLGEVADDLALAVRQPLVRAATAVTSMDISGHDRPRHSWTEIAAARRDR